MLRIAICDDEMYICNEIKNYVARYSIVHNDEFECDVFDTSEQLTQKYLEGGRYDLIFLDIDFSAKGREVMSGIDFGKKLRTLFENDNTAIVYVTSYGEYAIDSIKVRPFDYLKKPVSYEMIENIIDLYIKKQIAGAKIFEFVSGKNVNRIVVSNIRYFESRGRNIIIHTVYNEYTFNGKLSNVIKRCTEDFLCIHKSFIVNMNYIEKFTASEVILFGVQRETLPISKSKRTEVSERLLSR